MWKLLLNLFVAMSEKVFLAWYERAKTRQRDEAQTKDNQLSDDDIAKRLRKYQRD